MPPPLNLPDGEYKAHVKEQARLRQANRRARIKESRHVTPTVTGAVTPPSPPGPPAPSKSRGSYGTPGAAETKPRGNPRVAAVIDGLRARGLPDGLDKRDCAAIKASTVEPAKVVEAFEAAFRGKWGNGWLQENLSVEAVLRRYAGYEATQRPARRSTGREVTNSEDGPSPVGDFLGDRPMVPIDPTDYRRHLTEAKRLTLPERLALVKNGAHK